MFKKHVILQTVFFFSCPCSRKKNERVGFVARNHQSPKPNTDVIYPFLFLRVCSPEGIDHFSFKKSCFTQWCEIRSYVYLDFF